MKGHHVEPPGPRGTVRPTMPPGVNARGQYPIALPMLVLGTANRKKGIELADLVRPVGVEVRTLADFSGRLRGGGKRRHLCRQRPPEGRRLCPAPRPVGAGRRQRAGGRCRSATGRGSSPLDIPAPTPPTSRTTGCCCEQLGDTPLERRTARFVCHIAVADPSGEIRAESDASCCGRILFEPRGCDGFGYDPLFEIVEYHRTFAEFGLTGEGRAEPPRPGRLPSDSRVDAVGRCRTDLNSRPDSSRHTPCAVRRLGVGASIPRR